MLTSRFQTACGVQPKLSDPITQELRKVNSHLTAKNTWLRWQQVHGYCSFRVHWTGW